MLTPGNFVMRKKRTLAYIFLTLLLLSGVSYWFLMHTNRGSSLALYTIGGWNAPLDVKIMCGKDTDRRVYEKFLLPLAFDEDIKDQLRGFWFYSYYRDCLFAQGYDFKGNTVPHSEIAIDHTQFLYTNAYAGFSFIVASDTLLATDNDLNVDYDSDLLRTILTTPQNRIFVDTYLAHDLFKTPEDIPLHYREEPLSRSEILRMSTILSSSTHTTITQIEEADGTTRLVFMTPRGYVVDIHAEPLPDYVPTTLQTSLSFH